MKSICFSLTNVLFDTDFQQMPAWHAGDSFMMVAALGCAEQIRTLILGRTLAPLAFYFLFFYVCCFGQDSKLRSWQKVIPAMWGLGPRLEAGCDSFKSVGGIKEKGVASNPTSTQKIVAAQDHLAGYPSWWWIQLKLLKTLSFFSSCCPVFWWQRSCFGCLTFYA